MGTRMSFDKYVSSLDELLDMSASYFAKVRFESRVDPRILQHIKVRPKSISPLLFKIWSFSLDKSKFDCVKISPLSFSNIKE